MILQVRFVFSSLINRLLVFFNICFRFIKSLTRRCWTYKDVGNDARTSWVNKNQLEYQQLQCCRESIFFTNYAYNFESEMKKGKILHNSLINNFDIFWCCTEIKHLLTRIKILNFSRLIAVLWIQVGIWQCWHKIQPWGNQGWLLFLTQTTLVRNFCQKNSFDKKEDLLGHVFCSSFLLVLWWW